METLIVCKQWGVSDKELAAWTIAEFYEKYLTGNRLEEINDRVRQHNT